MYTCPNCGQTTDALESDSLFCGNCGAKRSPQPQEPPQTPQIPQEIPTQAPIQKSVPTLDDGDNLPPITTTAVATSGGIKWVPLLLVAGITLGALGGGGIYYLKSQENAPVLETTAPEETPSVEVPENGDNDEEGEILAESEEASAVVLPVDESIARQEAYSAKLSELVASYGILEEEKGRGLYDFAYLDFDGDGNDELMVAYSSWGNHFGLSLAVYTYENSKISRIFYEEETLWAGNSAVSGETLLVQSTSKGDFAYSLSGNGEDYLLGMMNGTLVEFYKDGMVVDNLTAEEEARRTEAYRLATEEWEGEFGQEPMSMARAKHVEMAFHFTRLDCYDGGEFPLGYDETKPTLNFGGSEYCTDYAFLKEKIMAEGITLFNPIIPASQLSPEVANAYRPLIEALPQGADLSIDYDNGYIHEYHGELKVLFVSATEEQIPLMFLGYFEEPWWGDEMGTEYVFASGDLAVWCYHNGKTIQLDDPEVMGDYLDNLSFVDGEVLWGEHLYPYDVYGLSYSNYFSYEGGKMQEKLTLENLHVWIDEYGTVGHDDYTDIEVPILTLEEYIANGWILDDSYGTQLSATRVNGKIVSFEDYQRNTEIHPYQGIFGTGGTGPGGSCFYDSGDNFVFASTVLSQLPE